MEKSTKNILLWVFSILFTLGVVYYQRVTGPTHPKSGSIVIGGQTIDFKLLRSHGGTGAAPVTLKVNDTTISAVLTFKRYKSNDHWTRIMMNRMGDTLIDSLPHQQPAGKVMYLVSLRKEGKSYPLTQSPVILRFKGAVPLFVLIPHILFMFLVMLFGVRAAMEAMTKGEETKFYLGFTLICLVLGGLILGPIVQKYAFGAYWTGWPIGHDLTDNKTFVVFIFLFIAWLKVRKNNMHRTWVVVATVVMLLVYSIPHSAMGSEIDYRKQNTETQK